MMSPEELERLPFFKDLDAEERALLSGITRKESAVAGQRIFEEGEPSHTFNLVDERSDIAWVKDYRALEHGGIMYVVPDASVEVLRDQL